MGPVAGVGFVPPETAAVADDESGCTCRIEQTRPRNEATLWLGLLGVLAGGVARRRRSSRRQ
jgi:MYXO-CTERM domain-containing protein